MALFGITRYLGDEDKHEKESPSGKEHAASILDKLHQQAQARKKRRSSIIKDADTSKEASQLSNSAEQDEVAEPKSAKKAKKRRSNIPVEPETTVKKSKEETSPSKKQRKAKSVSDATVTDLPETITATSSSDSSDSELEDGSPNVGDEEESTKEVEDEDADMLSGAEELDEDSGFTKDEGQSHKQIGGFTVIGDVFQKKKDKVQRVLPEWLSNPSVINNNIRTHSTLLESFKGLEEDLVEKLTENGITHLFPVQAQVIPVLLEDSSLGHMIGKAGYRPSDICCSAPTGSGKTLAFVLPIVQVLRRRVACKVRALIVLPVRDLATQVYKVFQAYCKGTKLKVGLVTGHKTFQGEQQTLVRKSHKGHHSLVDIIVATPGRLVDHINQTPGFNLKQLRYLVIDEADRMMEEIKQDWLTTVERAVYDSSDGISMMQSRPYSFTSVRSMPRQRPTPPSIASISKLEIPLQKLLFSATLSQNPEKLQQLNLFQPKLFTSVVKQPVESKTDSKSEDSTDSKDVTKKSGSGEFVGKYTTPSGLTEYYIQCSPSEKPLVLLHLMLSMKFKHVLCFTNSVESTHRLFTVLKQIDGLVVKEFSSSMHAVKRTKVLKQFSAGKIDLLICSDAMARGMDVENAQYVISYDSAPFLKTYIHRVGRTARAGRVGTAITFLEKKQIFHFKKMLKEAGKSGFKEMNLKPSDKKVYIEVLESALKELPHLLKAEKHNG